MALPHWLAHAFGIRALHVGAGAGAFPRLPFAVGAGPRPLLVFVIPEAPVEREQRGHDWGALLNHGTDAQLAPLALFDVRCARVEDLPGLGAAGVEGEPWMVLIDGDRNHFVAIDPATSERPARDPFERGLEDEESDDLDLSHECARAGTPTEVVLSLKRNDVLAAAIRDAAVDVLPALIEAERASQDAGAHEHLMEMLQEGRVVAPSLLRRSAAQLLDVAFEQPEDAYPRLSWILADLVRAELVWREIPGSRWASSSGCGVQIEGEEPRHVGCGMGHVPQLSRRFLHFFSNAE